MKYTLELKQATGQAELTPPEISDRASEYAKYLGRLGGLARASKLSKIERIEIARKAGKARWGKPKEKMEVKLV